MYIKPSAIRLVCQRRAHNTSTYAEKARALFGVVETEKQQLDAHGVDEARGREPRERAILIANGCTDVYYSTMSTCAMCKKSRFRIL